MRGRLGADPNVVGKFVFLDGFSCRVVGITPKSFTGPTLMGESVIWLPLGAYANMLSKEDQQRMADNPRMSSFLRAPSFLNLMGRLKPGVSLSEAQDRFRSMIPPLLDFIPDVLHEECKRWSLEPIPRFNLYRPEWDLTLTYLSVTILGAGFALLCVTCLNLANMYVVQGEYRHREIAIRSSLGGSRLRIIHQLLIEALLLALLGGALGLILTIWAMAWLNDWVISSVPLQGIQFVLDLNVLLGALGFCVAATLLSGLWPALCLSKYNIISNLKQAHGGLALVSKKNGSIMLPSLSTVGQIALSATMVIFAVLFSHSACRAFTTTPGYSPEGKLIVDLDFRVQGKTPQERQQLCQRLVDHMRSVPGVQSAGLSICIPFTGAVGGDTRVALTETRTLTKPTNPADGIPSMSQAVAGDYFQAVGLSLLQGRYFTLAECTEGAKVVIVDEALALKLRPDGNVLGRLLRRGRDAREIVGIVPSVRHSVLSDHAEPRVYYPLSDPGRASLVIRVAHGMMGKEEALVKRLRQEVNAVNPDIATTAVSTLSDHQHSGFDMRITHVLAGLFLFFSIVALCLAMLGIYGVKGSIVANRIPEFGIRRALGATGMDIVTLVLREGWGRLLVGVAIGMGCALVILHVFDELFFKKVLCGVEPLDPVSLGAALILLVLTVLFAGYIPARRAAKIDPMEALRYE